MMIFLTMFYGNLLCWQKMRFVLLLISYYMKILVFPTVSALFLKSLLLLMKEANYATALDSINFLILKMWNLNQQNLMK